MKTFKLSLLVALFAFAGNAFALSADEIAEKETLTNKAAKSPAEQGRLDALVAKDNTEKAEAAKNVDAARDAKGKAADAVEKAVTGKELAALEVAKDKAAEEGKAAEAYAGAKVKAGFFTKVNANIRNHWKCHSAKAGVLLLTGAAAYYIGKNADKAEEVQEELAA